MKYNSNNKPLVCMMKNSTCYKNTKKMTVKGVLWHSTGANNPNLKRYVQPYETDANYKELIKLIGKNTNGNDWNHIKIQVGLNGWIGKLADGTVASIQAMPWDYQPWGCGSGKNGSCNAGWIQFEICEDGLADKTYFNAVYKEACELTAYLCDMYNLDPYGTTTVAGVKVPVILCHADSYKLGLGSNHGDVLHWFKKHGKTMDDVRKDVAALMNKKTTTSTTTTTKPTTTTSTASTALKFKEGDIVNFVGGKQYASSNATSGSTVKASKAKVTATSKSGKHPYHIRAVNDKGAFISGVYGWVDASTVTVVKSITTTTTTKPTTSTSTSTTSTIAAGTKLALKSVVLYASAYSSKKSGTRTGDFYVWSKEVVNNKIRITNSKANVGKSNQITGWISYTDAKKSISTTTTTTTAKTKTLEDWAREVIAGKHGNGMVKRMASLKKAGCPYSYAKVRAQVNVLIKKK